jgi:hypothetical protein
MEILRGPKIFVATTISLAHPMKTADSLRTSESEYRNAQALDLPSGTASARTLFLI